MKLTLFMIVMYTIFALFSFWSIFYASSTILSAVCSAVITLCLVGRIIFLVVDYKEEKKSIKEKQ